MIFLIFAFFKISAASGAFVPSSLTTTGTFTSTILVASKIPFAILSHLTIPPKIFTKIAFTFGFFRIISNPFATVSAFAFPPTSRKFAGVPPI